MDLQGKSVLVAGLGKSGVAAIRLALRHGGQVSVCDDRPLNASAYAAEIERLGVRFLPQAEARGRDFDLVVQSPGVPLELPLFDGAHVEGELEFAGHYLRGPVLGVTGSNGKTTTTALIGHILAKGGVAAQVGGNIGVAPAAMVETSKDDQWNVLELSSFQLETIETFQAQIGLVLNITPDHLDRHRTMERYIEAKAKLMANLPASGVAILNAADAAAAALAARTQASALWFNAVEWSANTIRADQGQIWLGLEKLMSTSEVPLPGAHNIENVMAAAAAARTVGLSPNVIRDAVMSFGGVEHRLEFVRETHGVRWINDSKATNVDATSKALDAFAGSLWVILGGKDKNSDYRALAARLQLKARKVLLIGMAAPIIRSHLTGAVDRVPLEDCGDLASAVRKAASEAESGDTVLLAPACASFDQYQSYEHRGRHFKQLVNALAE